MLTLKQKQNLNRLFTISHPTMAEKAALNRLLKLERKNVERAEKERKCDPKVQPK